MRTLIAALLLTSASAATIASPAAAKTYWAERFDSKIRVLAGGAIEVTEIVVFRFEDGTFEHVSREIPKRRTDGVEILHAEMDGRRLPFGKAAGQVEVTGGSKVGVRWRFAPRSGTTHTFLLTYIARGVVSRQGGSDLLEWIALPTEHAYRIDASEVVVDAPAPFTAPPTIESRHVSDESVEPAGERVQILARGIRKNGWVKARLVFQEGAVIAAAPQWQQRELTADALAPRWMAAAGLVFAVGLVLLFALRQRYDAPVPSGESRSATDAPPDNLRPAVAGAVASNGGVSVQHAMAVLFSLADRGAITITEEPRRWSQRHFTLHRKAAAATQPAREEAVLLDVAFRKKDRIEDAVSLTDARNRITRRFGEFKKAVRQELRDLGLVDEERARVRSRFLGFSIALFLVAGLLAIPAIAIAREYQGWPLVIPGAVAAVAALAAVFYGALTPLSNDGVHRAERWRGYQRHLKEIARDREQLTRDSPARLLPFAVALGLASAWSKYVKHHPQNLPTWFHALSASGDQGGFPAFIAAGGGADGSAGASGGGGGGGAAGGGGSGAG